MRNTEVRDPFRSASLAGFVWASRGKLWPIFGFALAKVSAVTPLPILFMHMVDETVASQDVAGALEIAGWVVLLIVMYTLFAFAGICLLSKRVPEMIGDIRGRVFMKLQFIHFGFLDRVQVGRLLARYTFDTQRIEAAAIPMVQDIVPSLLHSSILLVILTCISPHMMVVIGVTLPIIVGIRLAFVRRITYHNEAVRRAHEGLTGLASEFISAIRLVRGFGEERSVVESMEETSGIYTENRRKQMKVNQSMGISAAILTRCLQAAVVVIGVVLTIQGSMTVGVLIAFTAALPHIVEPVGLITSYAQMFSLGNVSFQSIKRLLDSGYIEEWKGHRVLEPLRGEICFEGVEFSYKEGGARILNRLSIHIRPGEHVALVGPSGSGKSTVANLILGLYKPNAGRILIDGVPQAELHMRALRRKCAIVMQESILLSGTVCDNIRFGKTGASERDVRGAARAANAESFISKLEKGYLTQVGERGVSLSGGQRQRIAIARALLRDPRILILDEATSALDYESEKLVQEAIDRIAVGRTVITIAHRLSTVRKADRVVVLDEGEIVEQGTFDELLARNVGFFRGFVSTQGKAGGSVEF